MKVLKVVSPLDLQIIEEEIPKITNSKDILIKVKSAGVCGSDMSIYKGTSPVATYPRVIGHEFAGEVVGVGDAVSNVKIGDHVVVDPVIACGTCPICKKGRQNVCINLQVIGVHMDGGFKEYISVPEKNIFKIADSLPWDKAVFVEPYAVAAHVVSRGGVETDDCVLILGSGPIALAILEVCKILGSKCIITDLIDERLNKAKIMGADHIINSSREDVQKKVMEITENIGVDVSIDAACVGVTYEQAVSCTRPAGVVVAMGFSSKPTSVCELQITKNELDVRGSRLNNNKFPQVIEWMESGKICPENIHTDTFHFTKVLEAFERIKENQKETIKVMLTFQDIDN